MPLRTIRSRDCSRSVTANPHGDLGRARWLDARSAAAFRSPSGPIAARKCSKFQPSFAATVANVCLNAWACTRNPARSVSRSIIDLIPGPRYAAPCRLISNCDRSVSGRWRASSRLMAAASLGVIGTRRDFRPLAPASQRTRSSTRPRPSESVIISERPSGPRTASPQISARLNPEPTRIRTTRSSVGTAGCRRRAACAPGRCGRQSAPCRARVAP